MNDNERDALAAQVAALRQTVEHLWDEHSDHECCPEIAQALADTAEAAARYQREQRLEGAREFADRWRSTFKFLDRAQQAAVLAEMEREAGSASG